MTYVLPQAVSSIKSGCELHAANCNCATVHGVLPHSLELHNVMLPCLCSHAVYMHAAWGFDSTSTGTPVTATCFPSCLAHACGTAELVKCINGDVDPFTEHSEIIVF